MPNDLRNLRLTLSELHEQLEAAESVDAESLAMMRQVVADIEQILSRPAADSGATVGETVHCGSMVRRLTDAARGFESTHPLLSGAIGRVLDALAQMGI